KFFQLIEILAADKQVVVLVDEYDKPIIDYMDNTPKAIENRDLLKDFYSILKAQNHNIRFLFLTGVSKFSRISIFSDLNHLKDLTINPRYSRMLGYTQEEIELYFSYYIDQWEKKNGEKRSLLFENLKDHYNGYSWDGTYFVYNPFSILSFFDNYQFNNYWFATGSPTFLVNKLKNTPTVIDQYEKYEVDEGFFDKFNLEALDISVLLFQTGYLTIKERKDGIFILSYPNREVRTSFLHYLLEGFSGKTTNERNIVTREIKEALIHNKIDDFIDVIKILLSSIPYNIQIETREAYYHSLIYVALQLSVIDVMAEIQTALGRSDIVVSLERYTYIIEFKMGSAQEALDQIEKKQYYAPYLGKNKTIILLGIGLSEKERNIGEWKSRELDGKTKLDSPKEGEIETGKKEEKLRIAKQMLADKMPLELIIKYSGLTEAEITDL
ncbi:MAG: ATP-binding protein, partial [Acidobacteria bacterium]|nr:ATP-binding protein [Acidobacteriota bacterium]